MDKVKGNIPGLLSGKKSLLIITHKNADMDSFASATIVLEAIGRDRCAIVAPGGLGKQAKEAAEKLGISVFEEIPEGAFEGTVVVDTCSVAQIEPFSPESLPKPLIVIDHHNPKSDADNLLAFAEGYAVKQYPSSVEVVLESFPPVTRVSRVVGIAGIYADTRHLALGTSGTLKKVLELSLGEDELLSEGKSFSQGRPEFSKRIAVLKSLQKMRFERLPDDTVLATAVSGSFESAVAGQLISAGSDIALVAAPKNGAVRVSARAARELSERIHLGQALEKLGGGGHPGAAVVNIGVSSKNPSDSEIEGAISSVATIIKEILG